MMLACMRLIRGHARVQSMDVRRSVSFGIAANAILSSCPFRIGLERPPRDLIVLLLRVKMDSGLTRTFQIHPHRALPVRQGICGAFNSTNAKCKNICAVGESLQVVCIKRSRKATPTPCLRVINVPVR